MTSLGSTTAASEAGPPPQPAEFDALEADLDTIKVDIQHMRAEAESKQKLSEQRVAKRQHDLAARAGSSKIPAPTASRDVAAEPSDLHYRNRPDRPFNKASAPTLATPVAKDDALSPTTTQGDGTPAQYQDAVESPQANAYSTKQSPHFAQPTKAANRRVDETLRRDTPPAKSSPEGSPGKSTKAKAPNFATDKRAAQRNRQRTSLPDTWMSAQEQSSPVEKGVQKKEQLTPGSATSANSADPSPAGPRLRKKTSSYMTPTKSAQHRSIATLGEEGRARMTPRVNAGSLRINAALANQIPVVPSGLSPRSKLKKQQLEILRMAARMAAAPGFTLSMVDGLPGPPEGHRSSLVRGVANTIATRRDPDKDFMDPIEEIEGIKEKLGKEDLLRRDLTQEPAPSAAPRGSRRHLLGLIIARNEREALLQAQSSRLSEEEPHSIGHPKARDSENEPISQQTSGLRGQSSAEIAKALASGEHETARVPIASPVLLDDPAIKYHGPKPSNSDATISNRKPQDLDMVSNLGLRKAEVPGHSTSSSKLSRTTSLNAAAYDFVPGLLSNSASDTLTLNQLPPWEPQFSGDTLHPQAPGLFDDGPRQNIGTYSMLDTAYPPGNPCPEEHGILPVSDNVSWQEEPRPMFTSHLALGRNVDLVHGEFDTPTVSPTSDDTSPPWSKQQQQNSSVQWEISGGRRRKFGWTGGDGREISFQGMGPDAEHDPNSPVVYRNYRENTKTVHMHAARYPKIDIPDAILPPIAPKSMREYAEKMGLPRLPCTNDQWTGNYDVMPAIVPLAGLCYPCKADNNAQYHVGGGIDPLDWN
jgi:hypothetical protein